MKVLKILGGTILALVLVLVGVFFLMPAPEKPVPTGRYAVGISEFEVKDGATWVPVTAWYPASTNEGTAFPYMDTYLAEAFAQQQGLPAALLEDTRPSHAVINAEAAEGKHPVLLFNHGFGSFATQNLTQMEELASQGYIVLSLSHPMHSMVSKNAEGVLVYQRAPLTQEEIAQAVDIGDRTSKAMRASQSFEQWVAASSALEAGLFKSMPATIQEWASNNEVVLNALVSLSTTHPDLPFANQLDAERIGALGHSFGGSVAAHLAFNNPQIKAAMSLDSFIYPSSVSDQSAPICVLYGDTSTPPAQESMAWVNKTLLASLASEGNCEVLFKGAAHMNFSDVNHLPGVSFVGLTGQIDPKFMHQASNRQILGFFDHHFKGTPLPGSVDGVEVVLH
ncbi:alpha/beta hydrolase family protein [Enterovibrio coralii]|nr:hypothetical protein [Enterovibrio coralii]